jgi:hypothetical protein
VGFRSALAGTEACSVSALYLQEGVAARSYTSWNALVRNGLPMGSPIRNGGGWFRLYGFASGRRSQCTSERRSRDECARTQEHNPVTGRPGSRCRLLRAASPLARSDATAEERSGPPPQLRCGLTRVRAHSCGCPVRQTAWCRCPPAFHGCPGPALVRHPDRGSEGELAMIFAL